jgi:hypothetical protein
MSKYGSTTFKEEGDMKRKSAATYEVKKNESITVRVTPVSVGAFVAAAKSGTPLIDQSPTKKFFQFEFDIEAKVGEVEVLGIKCQFMGSEPATARYEIVLSSDDGSSFGLSPVRKPSSSNPSERGRQIVFNVV